MNCDDMTEEQRRGAIYALRVLVPEIVEASVRDADAIAAGVLRRAAKWAEDLDGARRPVVEVVMTLDGISGARAELQKHYGLALEGDGDGG